jgi:hypothetical protein
VPFSIAATGHPRRSMEEAEAREALRRLDGGGNARGSGRSGTSSVSRWPGTTCRLLLQSGFDPTLADVVDGSACGAYGMNPAAIAETCRSARAAVTGGYDQLLQCSVQLGNSVPRSEGELADNCRRRRAQRVRRDQRLRPSEAPPTMLASLARVVRART